jgi:hypothetical protein
MNEHWMDDTDWGKQKYSVETPSRKSHMSWPAIKTGFRLVRLASNAVHGTAAGSNPVLIRRWSVWMLQTEETIMQL